MKALFSPHGTALLFTLAIAIAPIPLLAEDKNGDIYGTWKITRDVSPEGTITTKTDRELRAVIGKTAVILRDRFSFNSSNCSRPGYQRSADDTVPYFYREWRVNPNELPLGERVTIVEVECDLHLLYPVDKHRLIIGHDGVFFEAVRVGPGPGYPPLPAKRKKVGSTANADIFGTWTVDGVTSGTAQELSRKQANILMGMPVYISASWFTYNENICSEPSYKRSKHGKAAYFRGDWRGDPARLPLPSVLTVVETACGTIYPISKKRLLIEDKRGLVFSAVPLSD